MTESVLLIPIIALSFFDYYTIIILKLEEGKYYIFSMIFCSGDTFIFYNLYSFSFSCIHTSENLLLDFIINLIFCIFIILSGKKIVHTIKNLKKNFEIGDTVFKVRGEYNKINISICGKELFVMNENEIEELVNRQRNFFYSGVTLDVNYRIRALKKLRACITRYEDKINEALKKDLGKSSFESYMCETGLVLNEIRYMLKHIKTFTREKNVPTPLAQFHSRSYKKPSPYGIVLIMSPWNYPFLLSMDPLVDALSAGNTIVLKPSAYSPRTSEVIKKIIQECFSEKYVAVITGGRAENTCLLNKHFDYIFFTGSQAVGKEVMKCASSHLTPVTLELGGKSPCIVEKNANIKLAAKRIVFGKFLNCGQTCVAPDYIFCDSKIKDNLIHELKRQIVLQFGKTPLTNDKYGKIVNEKHFNRISKLIDKEKVVAGGKTDKEKLKIEPTVMDNVTFEDAVMKEEIFGPVLPVLTYDSLESAIQKINSMAHPLALYLFTSDKQTIRKVMSKCGFGGGCINDTIIHLATSEMGFGGFSESGMGAYHGKDGFDTFSHYKSIVEKKTWLDLPMRYQPYHALNNRIIHFFLR